MAYKKRYEDSYLDDEDDEEKLEDLIRSADDEEVVQTAVEKWARIAEIAQKSGNKELYYRAIDKLSEYGE